MIESEWLIPATVLSTSLIEGVRRHAAKYIGCVP
jgi:hypothetical protein